MTPDLDELARWRGVQLAAHEALVRESRSVLALAACDAARQAAVAIAIARLADDVSSRRAWLAVSEAYADVAQRLSSEGRDG